MGVWTALVVALQLLLKTCLRVEAQVLGERRIRRLSANDSGQQFAVKGDESKTFPL